MKLSGLKKKTIKGENKMKRVIILIILLFVIFSLLGKNMNARPVMVMNNIVDVFPDDQKDEIEKSIVRSSEHFLLSFSHATLLFSEYEKASIGTFDIQNAKILIEELEKELKQAISLYQNAIVIAKATNYDAIDQQKIQKYDFYSVVEQKGLIKSVADDVIKFLYIGDINGLYDAHLNNLIMILKQLSIVKNTVASGYKPDPSKMNTLLNIFSYTMIFGNYSTVLGEAALSR
jgi:hypothetical protein